MLSKRDTPGSFILPFFHQKRQYGCLYLRRLSPLPIAKWCWNFVHLMTCSRHYDILAKTRGKWRRLPRFPAKMTMVQKWTTLNIEKSSYSYSRPRLRILKVSNLAKSLLPQQGMYLRDVLEDLGRRKLRDVVDFEWKRNIRFYGTDNSRAPGKLCLRMSWTLSGFP